jgi:integrase/recombinase XerD
MKKQIILSTFEKKLIIANYSDQTIQSYISALKLFLNYILSKNVMDVSDQLIQDYLFYCKTKKKYSFSSMKQVLASIRFLYLNVLEKPLPKALNIKMKKPQTLPAVLSKEEVSKLFKVTSNLKHKTILLLIYSAGLRLGELLNLKIGDIDSQRLKIHVRQAKGKKDRYVVLSEKLLGLLRAYYKEYNPKDFLIEGAKGGRYSDKSVQSVMKQALKKAGIRKKATVHTLRHSFATHLLDEGTDIRFIQELLGHVRLETTQIYTHVSTRSINKIKSPADSLDI